MMGLISVLEASTHCGAVCVLVNIIAAYPSLKISPRMLNLVEN
jgi:hypothetical protein